MAKGFTGEILHCNAVREQLNGSGVMRSTLISKDDVETAVLPNITMSVVTAREPTILANFNQQMMYLEGKTININETFNCSRIVLFIRPVATGYPTV